MENPADVKLCRVICTDVGRLSGAPGTVIVRVEHLPLGDVPPDEKPNVTVFILDQGQAATLDQQLVESFDLAMLRSNS
ncbi:hypothetical protein [Achromobacter insolitus]|uniref:hypothetical protein n=1 Tax=Achromobacter insolitus TaxID=217204 RepID=UPI00174B6F38|nr:hypothetical protein [Achromobacter insolitus]